MPIQPPKHSSVPAKKTEPSKPAAPVKTAAPAPPAVTQTIKGKTYTDGDEVPSVFTGTFESCNFNMKELKNKNLQAKFKGCTFQKGLKFIECNLHGAEGIPKDVEMQNCLRPRSVK